MTSVLDRSVPLDTRVSHIAHVERHGVKIIE